MNCPKCQQNLLIVKDVERMTYKAKEKIYERVFLNFLSSRLQPSERFDKCGNCHSYYVINCNENGVFRCYNNKCRFLFCTVCKKRVMSNNKLDFNEHVKCWNASKSLKCFFMSKIMITLKPLWFSYFTIIDIAFCFLLSLDLYGLRR